MVKVDNLKKLQQTLAKKEAEQDRYKQLIAKYTKKQQETKRKISELQAQIITENLSRSGMSFSELQELLEQSSGEENNV